jgi:ribosomal protein S18 acetylase RimI-like enzyme
MAQVGWRAPPPSAVIYDFVVYEEFRRRGYGRQTLTALEEKAKELGLDTISLHVFGHNQSAIALYQQAGYETTSLYMAKKLSV